MPFMLVRLLKTEGFWVPEVLAEKARFKTPVEPLA